MCIYKSVIKAMFCLKFNPVIWVLKICQKSEISIKTLIYCFFITDMFHTRKTHHVEKNKLSNYEIPPNGSPNVNFINITPVN